MNVCTKFHGNPSNSCWDISVWDKVMDRLKDGLTLPSLEPRHKLKISLEKWLMPPEITLDLKVLNAFVMDFDFRSMFAYQVMTCSRLGVRMVYCITAWILSQRFLGNRRWATRQITSWKPSIPSPLPSTCRKYTCTRRRWPAQVGGRPLMSQKSRSSSV